MTNLQKKYAPILLNMIFLAVGIAIGYAGLYQNIDRTYHNKFKTEVRDSTWIKAQSQHCIAALIESESLTSKSDEGDIINAVNAEIANYHLTWNVTYPEQVKIACVNELTANYTSF